MSENKFREDNKEAISRLLNMDFDITLDYTDEDIWYVFTDVFSHSKIILSFILKRVPVWDFNTLLKYCGDNIINWLDPIISPGIFPKMKYYKRNFGYNDELCYVKMGVSYQLLLMNHVVVYVGNISKSRMIDISNIDILLYKNNMRFYASYNAFLEDREEVFSGKSTKIIFIYNKLIDDDWI